MQKKPQGEHNRHISQLLQNDHFWGPQPYKIQVQKLILISNVELRIILPSIAGEPLTL
jgi:hypothetical protein